MQRYIIGLHVFGFLPLFYAIIYYLGDVWNYLTSDDEEEIEQIQLWQVIFKFLVFIFLGLREFFCCVFAAGVSIWFTVVCIYLACTAGSFVFRLFCMEFNKSMES